MPLLEVTDLRTYFTTDAGVARAVDGVSHSSASVSTLPPPHGGPWYRKAAAI